MRRTWALFAVTLLSGACAKSDRTTTSAPPVQDPFSCAELRRHISMLPETAPAEDRAARIPACESSEWTLATRRCVKAAVDLDEVAACASGNDCESVAGHIVGVLQSSIDSAELEMDQETLAYGQRQIVDSCRRDRWSEEAIACLLGVEHERDFDRCEALIETTKAGAEAEQPRSTGPHPATCDGVAGHVLDLARIELSTMDREMREMGEAMLDPLADEIRTKCEDEGWSAEGMACMVAAKNERDFMACEAVLAGDHADEAE